eukprot:2198401-Alexandrium_andersonii.AAC.1
MQDQRLDDMELRRNVCKRELAGAHHERQAPDKDDAYHVQVHCVSGLAGHAGAGAPSTGVGEAASNVQGARVLWVHAFRAQWEPLGSEQVVGGEPLVAPCAPLYA